MRHGSQLNPANRFERVHYDSELDQLEWDTEYLQVQQNHPITYLPDESQSIVSENDSPDIPFRYSLNPYRGCAHGCSYCYARNTHEYLGMNAGLDFETRIVVKHRAAELFREFLERKSWQVHPVTFSGVTDCYQPAERDFRLTRGCLEVALEYQQPVSIITKNALVVRDKALLARLAKQGLVHVSISLTTLDAALARDMEPRTSTPQARLRAISDLAASEIPVRAMLAPMIPGLNDHEMAELMEQVRKAGAKDAFYTWVRLPQNVQPVFREWLQRARPTLAEKVESRIQLSREGKFNQSEFGKRMRGEGIHADLLRSVFQLWYKKLGFEALPELRCDRFRRPTAQPQQLRLF